MLVQEEVDMQTLPAGLEVFEVEEDDGITDCEDNQLDPGWYYCFCQPGCMPDSDYVGPFASEKEAISAGCEDSLEECEDDEEEEEDEDEDEDEDDDVLEEGDEERVA